MQNSPRLLTSYSCTGTDIPAYYAGNDLGVIADGVLETEECRGMCCVYLNGILVPMTVAEGELYSLAFAIRAYCPEIVFTADSGTEIFTAVAHGLFNGQEMNVWSDDTLPDGLAEDTNYYIINKTDVCNLNRAEVN
jgi:hypothetical protein